MNIELGCTLPGRASRIQWPFDFIWPYCSSSYLSLHYLPHLIQIYAIKFHSVISVYQLYVWLTTSHICALTSLWCLRLTSCHLSSTSFPHIHWPYTLTHFSSTRDSRFSSVLRSNASIILELLWYSKSEYLDVLSRPSYFLVRSSPSSGYHHLSAG